MITLGYSIRVRVVTRVSPSPETLVIVIYDLPFVGFLYGSQGKGKTVFLSDPFTYEPLAWAINKGDPDFLNFLNNFLRQTKGDGFYERLFKKWIIGTDWQKQVE